MIEYIAVRLSPVLLDVSLAGVQPARVSGGADRCAFGEGS
jgi:hypothetical protein